MVHSSAKVLEEDERDAAGEAKPAVGEFNAIRLNLFCFGGLLGRHGET